MDKLNKVYSDLFKHLIPPSPLKQAFKNWRETTKQIEKEKQIKCSKCGQPTKAKSFQNKKLWNERRRELYSWQVRARTVGIPMLPAHRPSKSVRREWEYKIVEAEMEAII